MIDRNRGQSSNGGKDGDVWGYLWNLFQTWLNYFYGVLVMIFSLREKNLMKGKVIRIGLCPWGSQEEESIAHAIWFCPAATDVWNASHSISIKLSF
jgi:hypothetical protein